MTVSNQSLIDIMDESSKQISGWCELADIQSNKTNAKAVVVLIQDCSTTSRPTY